MTKQPRVLTIADTTFQLPLDRPWSKALLALTARRPALPESRSTHKGFTVTIEDGHVVGLTFSRTNRSGRPKNYREAIGPFVDAGAALDEATDTWEKDKLSYSRTRTLDGVTMVQNVKCLNEATKLREFTMIVRGIKLPLVVEVEATPPKDDAVEVDTPATLDSFTKAELAKTLAANKIEVNKRAKKEELLSSFAANKMTVAHVEAALAG